MPNWSRIALATASLALTAAALSVLPQPKPEQQDAAGPKAALAADTANPYRWADFADSLASDNNLPAAKAAYARALQLAPSVPAVWMRYTNFALFHGFTADALRTASRVLAIVPDYDRVLFSYFDNTPEVSPAQFLQSTLSQNPRALKSWLQYAIDLDRPAVARTAWDALLTGRIRNDDPLAAAYTAYLIRKNQPVAAQAAWAAHIGPERAAGYLAPNLIFNPDLAHPPSGAPLDWLITPSDEVEITTNSIRFLGKSNVHFQNLYQTVVLPRAGTYRLTVQLTTAEITTNEGIRLAVPDLNLASESVSGSGTQTISLDFSVAAPRAVRVGLIRRPSHKFDNKIAGVVHHRRWRLTPL